MRHRKENRKRWAVVLVTVVVVSALGVATAVAGHSFVDTPDSHTFHGDIEWIKDTGITRGCNPPANTRYCPDDFLTRGQMAAFLHRLALGRVVDADKLDGFDSSDFLMANGKAADSAKLGGLNPSAYVKHSELDEFGGVPGPQGPPGQAGGLSPDNVTIREASEGSGLVVVGNSYTSLCEPGEIVIGGGYEADFALVDLTGIELEVLGAIGLTVDLTDLNEALSGVTNVNVHAEGPVEDGGVWGWQIKTTANVASDITVKAICASS